jgi:hypothetical protein
VAVGSKVGLALSQFNNGCIVAQSAVTYFFIDNDYLDDDLFL